MERPTDTPWAVANQRSLAAALARVRAALERHAGRPPAGGAIPGEAPEESDSALGSLVRAFGLSPFERDVLLLAAGVELDATFAALCAEAQGRESAAYPTFGLGLAALEDPHWSALTPDGPLRRWKLVEVATQAERGLTASPLRIDERVLHYLAGVSHPDERLAGLIDPVPPGDDLVPSQWTLARRVAALWSGSPGPLAVVELTGCDAPTRRGVARAACEELGLGLLALSADAIPAHPGDLDALARLCERECVLAAASLYVDAAAIDPADPRAAAAVSRLVERFSGAVLLGTAARWVSLRRLSVSFDVRRPTPGEQHELRRALLGTAGDRLNGQLPRLASQFDLSAGAVRASVREALVSGDGDDGLADRLWDACRAQARPRLEALAQRIEPAATWDDLVLPEAEREALREIAAQVAHRSTVYDDWGFGPPGARGLGICALFAGGSGTGKTLAAEVLAHALRLDLYEIDLAGVVSKYIGETEKNLRRVFDAAEEGGAILFFDEADALFGKRGEVKDSHDRYANIEINYLLQRMESYRGLAILATNRKGDLDPTFLRRLRFVVNFPFPDDSRRAEIWRCILPAALPTEGLDLAKLARLNVTGGNIRSIALNAAFLAAGEGQPVRMAHLARAARREFAKMEKPLPESEIGGWT
jgi:hypothetical protein